MGHFNDMLHSCPLSGPIDPSIGVLEGKRQTRCLPTFSLIL